jgi:hypothetical protein
MGSMKGEKGFAVRVDGEKAVDPQIEKALIITYCLLAQAT